MKFWNLFSSKDKNTGNDQPSDDRYNDPLKSKIAKWKAGRIEEDEDPNELDEVINFLLKNNLLSDGMISRFDEFFDLRLHTGAPAFLLKGLLVNNSNAYAYEVEVDCLTHPYDFAEHFARDVAPILDHNGITEITFSFDKRGAGRDYEYHFHFSDDTLTVSKVTHSSDDFTSDFFDALNELLNRKGIDSRFYDLENSAKILLAPSLANKITADYGIDLK